MHNFLLYFLAKRLFHIFPFLLPHEKDYFGLKLLLKEPEGMFLDVGANDGVSALSFRRINSNYSILSFEPNPMHKASLERIKRRLGRFDFRLCAVGDEPGNVVLSMPTYRGIPLHSGAFCKPEQRRVFESLFPLRIVRRLKYVDRTVPVIRIDDLHLSPTVVKIDAEGYDLKILYGMEETIRRCRPLLMVENNPDSVEAVTSFLGNIGYRVFEYDYRANRFLRYRGGPTRNIFFTITEPADID
jgi:FkbM family methyltransferase